MSTHWFAADEPETMARTLAEISGFNWTTGSSRLFCQAARLPIQSHHYSWPTNSLGFLFIKPHYLTQLEANTNSTGTLRLYHPTWVKSSRTHESFDSFLEKPGGSLPLVSRIGGLVEGQRKIPERLIPPRGITKEPEPWKRAAPANPRCHAMSGIERKKPWFHKPIQCPWFLSDRSIAISLMKKRVEC